MDTYLKILYFLNYWSKKNDLSINIFNIYIYFSFRILSRGRYFRELKTLRDKQMKNSRVVFFCHKNIILLML